MKLFNIKQNTSGKVRTTLCIDEVSFINMEVLTEFGILKVEEFKGEAVVWFNTPYRVPKFNKFYASRISSTSDKYLPDLIRRILYLNPNPDKLLVKKIVEYILLHFVVLESVESEVGTGKMTSKPVIPFSQMEAAVNTVITSRMIAEDEYAPDNEDIVMFVRDSKLSKGDKITIRSGYRYARVRENLETAIHTVAEYLIDVEEMLKITGPRIENTKMVSFNNAPASIRTIRKYMTLRTRKIIEEHNECAPFKSDATATKFLEFLNLQHPMSLDEITATLGISKRTAVEFKTLYTSRGL